MAFSQVSQVNTISDARMFKRGSAAAKLHKEAGRLKRRNDRKAWWAANKDKKP